MLSVAGPENPKDDLQEGRYMYSWEHSLGVHLTSGWFLSALYGLRIIPPDKQCLPNNYLRITSKNFEGIMGPTNLRERGTFSRTYVSKK